VSLSGTFETLPIAGVLGLLAGSKKTGALRLAAGDQQATVFMVDGRCRAVEGVGHEGPTESRGALEARLVDVCFEIARADEGTFSFDAGVEPPFDAPDAIEVEHATAQLDEMLEQWEAVTAVIPSLDHQPRLHASLTVDLLELDRERWKLVVAIDGRRTVRQIVHKLGGRVIDVCRELVALVDLGAVVMSKTARAAAFAEVDTLADEREAIPTATRGGRIVPTRPYGPGVDEASPGEAPAPAAEVPGAEAVSAFAALEAFESSVSTDGDEHPGGDGSDDAASPATEPAEVFDQDGVEAPLPSGGPGDGFEDRGDADDVAAAVEALKERGALPADASPDEVRDRGALLRLFSALRDS
jgi:hypothetical protein